MKKTILKAFILFCCLFSIQLKSQVSHLVISQVYGGGGNTGATYRNDFVELFNPTGSTISLNGMSIQYASAAGTFTTTASAMGTLSGNVPPGGYFLISLASGGANGILLPTADLSFTGINMSGTTGKVALVSNTTATTCGSLTNIDFVGFGTANCNEGGANAPAPSSTTADIRNNNGCVDTDNNGANFTASTPNPRNSGSTPLYCNPTKFVITSINPSSPTAGNGFNVTIVSQDAGNNPNNVLSNTSFSLSNIGGGSIGGITTGTITAGTNSVVVSGVTLSSAATGATITATRSSGDNLSPGISIPFNVLSSGGTPTKFVITSISPSSPLQGNAFDIIVESQDGNNVAQNVSSNTNFTLSTNGNAGALSGTVSGMINAGSSSVTLNGLILPNAGTGVTLMATFASGDNLSAGTSTSFTVLGVASQLAFVNVPSTGTSSTNISSFTIEARRPDNSVDVNYTGNITVSKASGPGLLIGTDIVAAVAGVATFNNLQFNQGGTYTLNATTGLLNAPVSGNIVISQASPTWNFGVGSGSAAPSAGTPFPNLSISDITQGNNNGTTVLTTTVSASSGYTGASGSFNAGAAARTGALNINTSGSAYFEFTLTPSNNKYVSITGIKFGSRSTGTGPQAYSLRSSKDAYASDLATGTLTANSNWSLNNPTVNANSSLVNTAVTFRLYGYNGTGSPGVGSANWRIDDVVLTLDVLDCSTPTAYNLIGGGSYCPAGEGVSVGLSNSQNGTSYQLLINGSDDGIPVNGTGSSISFGLKTATGNYTVLATNNTGGCTNTMSGNATVSLYTLPTINASANPTSVCPGDPSALSATGANTYAWSTGTSGATINVAPISNSTFTVTGTDMNGCSNTATVDVTINTCSGIAAEALHFDGTNDKVIGTNSLLPQGSAARTFTAWINPSRVTGASQTIFHYGNEATASASGLLIANGNLYYVGHFSDFDGGAATAITPNVWTHVALTLTGKTVKFYVNGVLKTTGTLAATPTTTGTDWAISNSAWSATTREPFQGTIDEVTIWNRVLSSTDISNTMRREIDPVGQIGLVGLYHFNQGFADGSNGATTTLTDASTSASNGTLVNFGLTGSSSNWVAPGRGGKTKLVDTYCGTTLTSLSNTTQFACYTILNASNYQWEFTDLSNSTVYTYTRGNNATNFYFYLFPTITYGKTYSVRVRGYVNGAWQAYGESCTFSTPSSFPTSQLLNVCGTTITPTNTQLACNTSQGATNYIWEFTNTATSQVYTIYRGNNMNNFYLYMLPSAPAGNYDVVIRAVFGSTIGPVGSTCNITFLTNSGRYAAPDQLENEEEKFSVNLFPNPSNGQFEITSENIENLEVEIFDALGKVVLKESINSTKQSFDLMDKDNGFYFVRVSQNGKLVYTNKIIKQ